MIRKLLLAAIVVAGIAGCGGQSPAPGTPGAPTSAANPAPSAHKGITIAVVPKGLTHQYWQTVHAGAKQAAKEAHVTIIWKGPPKETDINAQINIIEDMISRKVNAIVMAACDENALVGVIKKATKAHIPVVTIDSGVESSLPISFVATDNIAGAKDAAIALARQIGDVGKVGLIPFVQGAATSELREKGFKDEIKAHPNIQLVATLYSKSDVATGMAVTEDMLTAHPDIKGIFAANEAGALGAVAALHAIGKAGKVKLVAFDASDGEIAALKDGTIQALIVQNPFEMGYKGVKTALDHLAGKPVPKRIDTGVTVVTMKNFNEPKVQKLLYPLKYFK